MTCLCGTCDPCRYREGDEWLHHVDEARRELLDALPGTVREIAEKTGRTIPTTNQTLRRTWIRDYIVAEKKMVMVPRRITVYRRREDGDE